MLADYLNGKGAEVAQYDIDLFCTFMDNYSGKEVVEPMRELNMKMFADLMNANSFVQVSWIHLPVWINRRCN